MYSHRWDISFNTFDADCMGVMLLLKILDLIFDNLSLLKSRQKVSFEAKDWCNNYEIVKPLVGR